MEEIIQEIKEYFEKKQGYINLFINYNTRIEGWFLGELINFLYSKNIKINSVGKPIKEIKKEGKTRKPDLILKIDDKIIILELKAISIQDGGWRNLETYFEKRKMNGLVKDFEKLSESNKYKEYLIIFAYSNTPIKINEWEERVKRTEKKYNIKEISKKQMNGNFLISLWTK